MSDGTRLAARIWMPDDAEHDPVPAILEYLPYRKGDAMARRDSYHHPWFAGHGYASVRVDLRGSGATSAARAAASRSSNSVSVSPPRVPLVYVSRVLIGRS